MGSIGDLNERMIGDGVDLYLSDGPYGQSPRLKAHATVVRHDTDDGQIPSRTFKVIGGSRMSVMCSTVEQRDRLAVDIGRVMPVGLP